MKKEKLSGTKQDWYAKDIHRWKELTIREKLFWWQEFKLSDYFLHMLLKETTR